MVVVGVTVVVEVGMTRQEQADCTRGVAVPALVQYDAKAGRGVGVGAAVTVGARASMSAACSRAVGSGSASRL